MLARRRLLLALALAPVAARASAAAEEPVEIRITIKGHRFEPEIVEVPADRELKLIVTNADETPEEFESIGLKIERVIAPGKTAEFTVRPLRKNRNYKFFGEFHPETAQGQLVVK